MANRAFTALAVLSLALGIGADTAIYSFMDSILRAGRGCDWRVCLRRIFSRTRRSPAAGRLLIPDIPDDDRAAPSVAMLSHAYSQRRFGGAVVWNAKSVEQPCTV
jgi:phytoene/squalene synthetase